jgi:hypothetical protein
MSSAIRQALEAGAVCFDARENWLPGSRAPDHKHGHLTPHVVVEPTWGRVIPHYGQQVFDNRLNRRGHASVPPPQCEIGSPRLAPSRRQLGIFFDVAGPCGTRKTSSVAVNGAVLATLLDCADPRRARKWFAGLADRLGRARALGDCLFDSEQRDQQCRGNDPNQVFPPARVTGDKA